MSFVSGALFVEAARQLRRDVGPLFAPNAPLYALHYVYNALSTLLTMWVFAYMCGPFQLLDFTYAWNLFVDLKFLPHIVAVLALVALSVLRPVLRKAAAKSASTGGAGAAGAGEGSSKRAARAS
mgnify:CR=1 FL=1